MSPLAHRIATTVAALGILALGGCVRDNHRDYCYLQQQVMDSTVVLWNLKVSVPWEYVETMLGKPDYAIPAPQLRAFLQKTGNPEVARWVERRIRDTYEVLRYAAGNREELLDRLDSGDIGRFEACTVKFYDESAHFDRPFDWSLGFITMWYIVDHDGNVACEGPCSPGNLLHKATTKSQPNGGDSPVP